MIWTNDPETPEIDFGIVGHVVPKVEALPLTWNAGEVTEDHDGTAVAKIGSPLDANFKIASRRNCQPKRQDHLQAVGETGIESRGLERGIRVHGDCRKGDPLGTLSLQGENSHHISSRSAQLTSTCPPCGRATISFLPPVPIVGSGSWSSTKTLLNLGDFRHEQGSKVALPALVSAMKGSFQLLRVSSRTSAF